MKTSLRTAMFAAVFAIFAKDARADAAPPETLDRVVQLPTIEVSTSRPGDRAPVARSVLTRADLLRANHGEDTPMVLATLPGAFAYSDAGNGIGYSYLAIRGFPQRRISVLVNGVPLNDPESHEVYWIDHPDLLASAARVEVQRGVGPALYGAAGIGGSVDLETSPFRDAPQITASASGGSFNTRRLMLEMNSGRLTGDWNLYGRYSRIETDGYRDQSWSKLWSYALSARKLTAHQSFRVNLYGGPENTHLAYLGVPEAFLSGGNSGDADRDRKVNPLDYPGEQDHFFEPHYELIHAWTPRAGLTLTQTLFWFDGRGYYDERRFGRALADFRLASWTTTDSTLFAHDYYAQNSAGFLTVDAQGRVTVERFDVVRRREVVNRHYGWVPRARFEHARGALTIGGELRAHDGHHTGRIVSGSGLPPGTEPDRLYYDYHPRTLAAGLFAREEWNLAPQWLATADLAWRHQAYHVRDDRFDGVHFDQPYDFALPRLGLTWTPREDLRVFGLWATARREPALRDLYDGEGPGSVPLYAEGDPLIRPERVRQFELGAAWSSATLAASANVFRMDFRDELVYAGQFDTDLGYPILGNAARSVHQGLELSARATRALGRAWSLELNGNATFSDNHFIEYREIYGTTPADVVSYDGNPLGFFPATLGNLSARAQWKQAFASVEAQHAGRLFVDNTGSNERSIAPHTTLNLSAGCGLAVGGAHAELSARIVNALDKRYATSGYLDYDASGALVPTVVPAATRGGAVELRVTW